MKRGEVTWLGWDSEHPSVLFWSFFRKSDCLTRHKTMYHGVSPPSDPHRAQANASYEQIRHVKICKARWDSHFWLKLNLMFAVIEMTSRIRCDMRKCVLGEDLCCYRERRKCFPSFDAHLLAPMGHIDLITEQVNLGEFELKFHHRTQQKSSAICALVPESNIKNVFHFQSSTRCQF